VTPSLDTVVRGLGWRWLECAANCGDSEVNFYLLTSKVPRWSLTCINLMPSPETGTVTHAFDQL